MLKMKRAYEKSKASDGYRILVDRLWPRGVSKELASLDYWAKNMAPTKEIRQSFNHNKDKFEEFKKAYLYELNSNKNSEEFLDMVSNKLRLGDVTLVYAAKDENINHVVVLKDWIKKNLQY